MEREQRWVRFKPYNPELGYDMKSIQNASGLRLVIGGDLKYPVWYGKLTDAQITYLSKIRVNPSDPDSPCKFNIMPSKEAAQRLEAAERAAERAELNPGAQAELSVDAADERDHDEDKSTLLLEREQHATDMSAMQANIARLERMVENLSTGAPAAVAEKAKASAATEAEGEFVEEVTVPSRPNLVPRGQAPGVVVTTRDLPKRQPQRVGVK